MSWEVEPCTYNVFQKFEPHSESTTQLFWKVVAIGIWLRRI